MTLAENGICCLITNFGSARTARAFVFGTWSWNGSRVVLTQNVEATWEFVYRGGALVADKTEDSSSVLLGRR
ncbi:MAG: hypothetical protein K2Q09_01965 [Phycisphaerales bacterium]|nr:hypothetical protein [Phycisphaerales bacterium]